jgi:GTP:adenosylcobinamide-phosphate guanylyltransferase
VVRRWGSPEHIFLNVNTPEDHRRAKELARA